MKNITENPIKYLGILVALFITYVIAGRLGLSMAFFNHSVSPVWPATGIAIAALVILGYRFWPAIALGAFVVNLLTTPSMPISLAIAAGNTLEGLAGAYLINKYANKEHALENIKTAIRLFLILLVVPIISALIGGASLIIGGFAAAQNMATIGATWWIGDVVGAFVVIPLIFTFAHAPMIKIKKERYAEIILAFIILLLTVSILFVGWPIQIDKIYRLVFLCIPPLVWIALRSCLRITTLATTLASGIAIYGTVYNLSIFNLAKINSALILLQIFIGIITPMIMHVSIIATEHEKALERIKILEKRKR